MPKIAVEVDLKQLEELISQLRSEDRISLIQKLEQKTWRERFRTLTGAIDKRHKRFPLSHKEILNLVKQAQRERYASGRS